MVGRRRKLARQQVRDPGKTANWHKLRFARYWAATRPVVSPGVTLTICYVFLVVVVFFDCLACALSPLESQKAWLHPTTLDISLLSWLKATNALFLAFLVLNAIFIRGKTATLVTNLAVGLGGIACLFIYIIAFIQPFIV